MKPGLLLGLGAASAVLLLSRRAKASGGWLPEWVAPSSAPTSGAPGPTLPGYITTAQRDERYGPLRWVAAPTSSNPEAVRITNDFGAQLVRRTYPRLGTVTIHQAAAQPLADVLSDLERDGQLGLIRSNDGIHNPRLVRGSTTSLSSHAYGTSIDLNASENPLGGSPTDDQRHLAEYFERHGWFWGNRFDSRPDPMHFEWVG